MTDNALILGSTGRFGRAAAAAFRAAGWRVTEWRRADADDAPGVVRGDLRDRNALRNAADVDVIVNGLNPAYPDWADDLPWMTSAVIDAARATGATVLIPGNVYNYGRNLPPRLNAGAPHVGDHKKARLRIKMEETYRAAGVKTIILRGGDFIDTGQLFGPNPYDLGIAEAANQLAAMPSLHVGWSLLVALGVLGLSDHRWRWLVLLHPIITTTVVVITANHYWLDGLAAAVLVVVAWLAFSRDPEWDPNLQELRQPRADRVASVRSELVDHL